MKPRIFIASSSEQLDAANRIAHALEDPERWTVNVWTELFAFNAAYIESLESALEQADFAIVVLTGDDAANVRHQTVVLPRDNVIFELGLFFGRLGRPRCFFFVEARSATQIASDLSGVKPVEFYLDAEASGSSKPSLETQAKRVKEQIQPFLDRGEGLRYGPNREAQRQQETLWRFSLRIEGNWWERIRKGDDDASAMSYLTLSLDPATNAPLIEGKVYDLSGESYADWRSFSTSLSLAGPKPTILYHWEGSREGAEGQTLGGHGVFRFDDRQRLESAAGYYFDTNLAQIENRAPTRVKHLRLYRCSANEVATMERPFSDDARSLIRTKINALSG